MFVFLALIDFEEDKEKFIKIYNQYKNLMFYVANQILKNDQDAEDAVQEAFLAIAKNIVKISDPVCIKTKSFVVIVVERKAIDIIRKRKTRETEELDEELIGYDVNFIIDDSLTECILKLPAMYREVILLKYHCGYKLTEIAKILGIKLNYARVIDQRAKTKLRKICEKEGYEI